MDSKGCVGEGVCGEAVCAGCGGVGKSVFSVSKRCKVARIVQLPNAAFPNSENSAKIIAKQFLGLRHFEAYFVIIFEKKPTSGWHTACCSRSSQRSGRSTGACLQGPEGTCDSDKSCDLQDIVVWQQVPRPGYSRRAPRRARLEGRGAWSPYRWCHCALLRGA